jgi:hypothetical protein
VALQGYFNIFLAIFDVFGLSGAIGFHHDSGFYIKDIEFWC